MSELGAYHARAVVASFSEIDKLLGEIETLAMPKHHKVRGARDRQNERRRIGDECANEWMGTLFARIRARAS